MQEEDFDYVGALGALYYKEPENRFYQSLRRWHEEKGYYTKRQKAAILKDYEEKINGGGAEPAAPNSSLKACGLCGCVLKSKFEYTLTKENRLVCLRCFDKEILEEYRKNHGKSWWQTADKILEQPKVAPAQAFTQTQRLTQTQTKEDVLSKDENKRKVEILFLDSSLCDEYSFVPHPNIDAIRPSITANLIDHTEEDVLIEADGKQHRLPKAEIRKIFDAEKKQTLFENEPFYKLYADKLDSAVPQASAITIGGREATPAEKKALEVVKPLVEKHGSKWWNNEEALKEAGMSAETSPTDIEKCVLQHPHTGPHKYAKKSKSKRDRAEEERRRTEEFLRQEDERYTKEYILDYAKNMDIYDLRDYPKGFTKEAVKELWDNDFKPFGCGHFQYLIPRFKGKFNGTFEELWQVMDKAKEKAWQEWRHYEERNIEHYWNFALEHAKNYAHIPDYIRKKQTKLGEPNPAEKYKEEERASFEHWKETALRCWESANAYRKALGMDPLPEPEFAKTTFEEVVRTLPPKPGTPDGFLDKATNYQSKACARCGTTDENAEISHVCNSTVEQWVGKLLCWKCYVDTHVETYIKFYSCPECKERIVEWAGSYDDWSQMRCKKGHMTNVNFLVKAERAETEGRDSEKTFLDRHRKTESGAADGNAEKLDGREVQRIRKDRAAEELAREFGNISIEDAYELYLNAKISLTEYDIFSEYLSKQREAESQQEDGGLLSDNRDRAIPDLQRIYGKLTDLKAEMLYQRGKISSREMQKILDWLNLPTAEEETALQEHKEQQAEEKDLVPIEVLQKFKRVEREEEKQTQKRWF